MGRPAEAVFLLDRAEVITGCNRTAEEIFGWSPADLRGKSFSEVLLPGPARGGYREFLFRGEAGANGSIPCREIEQHLLHRDGHEFPVAINICQLGEPGAGAFLLIARDLRERRRQGQVLRQASQNQQIVNAILKIALEDLSLDEILLHALESVLLLKTPKLMDKGAVLLVADDSDHLLLKAHKGFGRQQVQACRRVPFGTCHCGRAALTSEIQFSECVDDRHDIRLESMMPHGHYCVPICSGDNLLGVMSLYLREGHVQNDEEKEVLWAVSNILAGVIERKKVEIQRSRLIDKQEEMITRIFDEQKLTESIIQSLNAGLMVFDPEGRVVKINQSGRLILGQFLDQDLAGTDDVALFGTIAAVRSMWKIPPTRKTDEVSLLNARGEEKTLQYTVVPWENSTGLQIGFILLFHDSTEMRRIQREMEKMNRLGTVAEIASAVAHEVRNPLAGIKTMSQAIEENCAEHDENREYITRIIKQVDRLNDLLTEFFTYAKPGTAKKERVAMAHIVREIRLLLKARLDSRRIILEEDYAEDLPEIHVDPDQMQQVFLNLMLNAVDALSGSGRIEIRARVAERNLRQSYLEIFPELKEGVDYVAVSFRDNGRGMTPEVAAKAFEPFFSTKHQGSGLGLAIVYRILRENNAFILTDTTQKQGVGFIMMFESAGR
jgi:PAS domain S-box-containing protein